MRCLGTIAEKSLCPPCVVPQVLWIYAQANVRNRMRVYSKCFCTFVRDFDPLQCMKDTFACFRSVNFAPRQLQVEVHRNSDFQQRPNCSRPFHTQTNSNSHVHSTFGSFAHPSGNCVFNVLFVRLTVPSFFACVQKPWPVFDVRIMCLVMHRSGGAAHLDAARFMDNAEAKWPLYIQSAVGFRETAHAQAERSVKLFAARRGGEY